MDCALLPPLDALSIPLCDLVPGVGVAAEGPTESEWLHCNSPLAQIQSIAAHPGSEDAACFAAATLATGMNPAPMLQAKPEEAAALALGGDSGFDEPTDYREHHDLGVLWHTYTGLPMVLRVWACRFRAPFPTIRTALFAAYRESASGCGAVAEEESDRRGIPVTRAHRYLTETLHFSVASKEAESLRKLRDVGAAHDLCPQESRVVFC